MRAEGAQGPHFPAWSGARGLEVPGVSRLSTLGPGLTVTSDVPAPHPTASRSQPVLSHLLQGADVTPRLPQGC